MAVITLPSTLAISRMTWAQQRRDMAFASAFGSQAVEISPPLWAVAISGPNLANANAGAWQSLLMRLRGKTNQLELWNLARPAPLGTMRGAMALSGTHAQGSSTLSILAAGEIAKTLLQGDLLGIGSGTTQQVVMVMADATSDGAGAIAVSIEPPLRNGFASAAPVVWDKPKALFRAASSKTGWEYTGSVVGIGTLELIEDWRA